jgi:hypothetical protein
MVVVADIESFVFKCYNIVDINLEIYYMTELEKDLYELVTLALNIIIREETDIVPIFLAKAEKTLSMIELS